MLFKSLLSVMFFVVLTSARVVDTTPITVQVHVDFSNAACGTTKAGEKKNLASWALKLVDEEKAPGKPVMVKTSATGDFTVSLKPGNYQMYMTKKINKALKTNLDVACKKMMAKSYGQIMVSKGHAKIYRLIVQFECSPCKGKVAQ